MSGPGPKDDGVGPDVGISPPADPAGDDEARFPTTLVSARPLDSVALDGTKTRADGPPRSERRPLALPSELSGGRFRLLERIGTGGMGVVYAATDRKRGERVALKTLQNLDGAGIERLKREFRALASVSHPNLVRLRELFADADEVFFTMDLVEGEPFLAAVHRDLAHGFAGVRDKFRQLAEGLDALHAHGKIHRDLKPSNVMLQKDGRVVVLDFGVACDFETSKRERSDPLAGTPAYMSPEQALGEPMSPASDWYAFGTMLYEVLAGRLPFDGPIITLLSEKASKGPPPIAPDTAPPGLCALAFELLARNPEARPTAREILERLSNESDLPLPEPRRPASSGMQRVEFVGRERELGELELALHRASCGELVTVLVSGASGIGKTTLVREFIGDECTAKGALVLESKCFEYESVRYNALDGVIDGLRKHLVRMSAQGRSQLTPRYAPALAAIFPALGDVLELDAPGSERLPEQPGERRRTAFLALRELLTRVSALAPLVLFLDDLQWGDSDSARLLQVLLAPPAPPPLLLIASCRADERKLSPLLSELESRPELFQPIELRLEALSEGESRALLARLLRRDPPSDLAPIVAEARGNPFFLSELALAPAANASAPSVAGLVDSRLRALPASALALLEVVAIAEMPLSPRVAETVAASSDGERALIALRSAKLVRATLADAEERVQCYHDRIREVVVGSLDPERARALHLRLATALEGEPGVDAERLVGHFERAGEHEKTALYAERAGDAAGRALAFSRAASFYELAFSLLPDADRARRVRTRLAEALENAGRTREAAEHYLALAHDETNADQALDFRRRAASQLLSGGHLDDGLAVLDGVLREVGLKNPKTDAGVLARLVAERARLRLRGLAFQPRAEAECDPVALRRVDAVSAAAAGYTRCDFVRGALFAGIELRLALSLGEKNRVARALANEILFAANEGGKQLPRVEVLRREIDRLLPDVRDPRVLGYLKAARGASHMLLGDVRSATPEILEGARVLAATGRPSFELTFVRSLWALCLQIQGSVVEAGDALTLFLADARERADLQAERYFAIYRTFGLLGLDRADFAHAELERSLVATERAGNDFLHYAALHAFVLIAIYRREERKVFERYREQHQPFFRTLLRGGQLSRAYVKVYIAYCSLSIATRVTAAERDVAGLHRIARSLFDEKAVFASAHAHEVRAAALAFEGRAEAAVEELLRAAVAFDSLGQTLQAAAARHRRGLLLAGALGAEEVEKARRVAFDLRIVNPERMFACYTPGFEP